MKQLPKNILVLSIIRYTNKGEIVDTLKEFFKGVPHIPYTDTTYNSGTYYIVPYNKIFCEILGKITFCTDLYNIFGFATYGMQTSSSTPTFTKNIIREFFNFRYLPLNITIDLKHLETLKLFTEN